MKSSQLIEMIRKVVQLENNIQLNKTKQVVRDVFRDELKDIIIESFKSNNTLNQQPINEIQQDLPLVNLKNNPKSILKGEELREAYRNVLNETANFNTSQFTGTFNPNGAPIDNENGALPKGEVDMEQIVKLMGG